jgi:hypothetical protein
MKEEEKQTLVEVIKIIAAFAFIAAVIGLAMKFG